MALRSSPRRAVKSPGRFASEALLFIVLFCIPCSAVAAASDLPRIPSVHGTTFADRPVNLPDDLHGRVAILVIGFSQGSRDAVTLWGKKLADDYYESPSVLYYEMPVLASVPKLLRGFVTGRIKSAVSDRGKPHFLPLTADEAHWRSLVGYSNPDVPYILLIDEHGIIRWQSQGPPTSQTYAALKQQAAALSVH